MDDSALIPWDDQCLRDLSWWLDPVHLQEGVSLAQVSLDLDFWLDASDLGWGAHLGREVVSSRWSLEEASPSINARELLAVERDLLHFLCLITGSTVSIFTDNSTAVAYLQKLGGVGTRSAALSTIAQRILCWVESHQIVLALEFIMGQNNILADALSRPNQVQGSEWVVKLEVFEELRQRWPVMIDLFATSANHRCSLSFSPFQCLRLRGRMLFCTVGTISSCMRSLLGP